MKNIFKIKRHPHRSNEPSPPSAAGAASPASAPSPTAVAPSCASDHRAASSSLAVTTAPSPTSASPAEATTPAAVIADKRDYFSSEEEFQVQLALAISASNSEFRDDPDGDQIRAAKLISLGRQPVDKVREEGTAESLSRRYWDYNVLDYGEKVVDGFYDIFRPSANSADQGKMPSLIDLQTGIGDLGFEVIVVNRTIDPALVELEQIAQCMSLGCPASDVGVLVQRISELVTENMGGPVKDANEMFARWMEKSTELRNLQQTSLLPIGCIKVGLSRHRALLFKVLADNVGIPCRLVKGSHYTGVDDDAVNILKLDDEREYLVDLMAAPGTLIPADVPSIKDTTANFHSPKVRKNFSLETNNTEGVFSDDVPYDGHETSTLNDKKALSKGPRYGKPSILSSHGDYNEASAIAGSSSGGDSSFSMQERPAQVIPAIVGTSSKQKGVIDFSLDGDNNRKGKLNIELLDGLDSRNLFAELNPFQAIGAGKAYPQYKATDARNVEYQKRRENIAVGVGRSQNPLVWKGRSACNEDPNTNQNNFMDGLLPRKNLGDSNASSSQTPNLDGKVPSRLPNNVGETFFSVQSTGLGSSESSTSGLPLTAGYSSSDNNQSNMILGEKNIALEIGHDSRAAVSHAPFQSSNYSVLQKNVPNIPENNGHNFRRKHERKKDTQQQQSLIPLGGVGRKKDTHDQLLRGPNEAETSYKQAKPNRIDTVLDDVAAWEIPWEDLVIGERIGLGSYGEVYRADWNGTEVAVKKFLDQDFYGDALDEFRSEVRIMRRLRHPNIVLFMGAVTRPPNLSIVSEFLPRGSLYKILHRPNCQIDEKRRIKMALDVAKGMNCLHISVPTIVHRDLKSPNLLVDKNWTVKVCDFGLSRLKHSTFLSSKSTAGTPEWMAPEVLRNEPSNEKCDVYSFGVILWELATLRMPWSGMNPMQVVGAVGFQERRLDIPKEVDPLVASIIWECWQTDPNLRPSFAKLTTVLKSLQRLVISTHQETQSPPVPQEISVNSTP